MLSLLLITTVALSRSASGMVLERGPQGPDNCAENANDQCFVADLRYYSDKDCTQEIPGTALCEYNKCDITQPGQYACGAGNFPTHGTPFWVKNAFSLSNLPDLQILFTEDQSCPPSGPGAVFATLNAGPSCVQLNKDGNTPGITIYSHGGAAVAKRDAAAAEVQPVKRGMPKCKGFNKNGDGKPSESQSVQVSSIVDCTNGAESGCTISKGDQHTESVTTMYSATAGGGIEGVFMVSATFGMSFEMSETTTEQEP